MRAAVAFVALIVAPALFAAPAQFMGMKVKEKTFTAANGKKIVLHVTASGPIPEENAVARFDMAGPFFDSSGKTPTYDWSFGLAIKGGAKPSHIAIEDVSGKQPVLFVDDAKPELKRSSPGGDANWSGSSSHSCRVDRSSDCAKWLFSAATTFKIFRAEITFPDGSRSELYQGAEFSAATLKPMLQAIGAIQ